MFSALILARRSGVPDDAVPAPPKADLATYKEATARAGKSADAHVRLALWCEAHGLTAERLKHLSLAVLYDPSNTLARGLMGLVAYHGKWDRPDVVGQQIQNDPAHQAIVKEYLDRRAATPDTADAQMKLAAWCEENGLKEQAMAHYTAVTRIDPSRDAAWKHLGYKKQGDRWVKPEEAAAAKQEAARQKQADKHWKPKLEKLRDGLESKDAAQAGEGRAELTEVTDPRAVPMIWAIFVRGGERQQIAAVQMLGQIDGPSASNGLAVLAVFSPGGRGAPAGDRDLDPARSSRRRRPVDRVSIRKPFKYQVRHVNGPGSPGELFVEGERFNIQRFYQSTLGAGLAIRPVCTRRMFRLIRFESLDRDDGTRCGRSSRLFHYLYIRSSTSPAWAAMARRIVARFVASSIPLPNCRPARYSPWPAVPQNATAILNHLATNPANQNANAAAEVDDDRAAARPPNGTCRSARQLERNRQSNQILEQKLAMDVQFRRSDQRRDQPGQRPHTAGPEGDHRPGSGRRAGEVEELVDRPARIRLPIGRAGDQADLYRLRQRRPAIRGPSRACFAAGTLVQTIDGPQADRIDPGWRSGLVAGHFDRSARVSARGGHPSQSACRPRSGSRSVANRSSRPASTASGKPARAGRWPASSRPAIACGWSAAWSRSNRSRPTRLNLFTTSTSPRTATSSWGPRGSWSTTSASCSRSSSRLIASPSWARRPLRRSKSRCSSGSQDMVRTILMCCALLGSDGADDEQAPDTNVDRSCGLPDGQEQSRPRCRCPRPAGSLVRGPRPDGRAAQASLAGGPVRPVQRAGAGTDGAGRLSRQMGPTRRRRPADSE